MLRVGLIGGHSARGAEGGLKWVRHGPANGGRRQPSALGGFHCPCLGKNLEQSWQER
jgi:hypothetical protein